MIVRIQDAVARQMMMRARCARSLGQAVYLDQAADSPSPALPAGMAAKLVDRANPGATGGIGGMPPLHAGTRIRLTEHLELKRGLATDASPR